MIQQTAPFVATALLNSLCAGAICYTVLRIILAIAKDRLPIICYHLCNITLIIPLVYFIWPILTIGSTSFTAPILPADPVTITNNSITATYTPGTVTHVTSPGVSFSAEGLWSKLNLAVVAYSNTIMILYVTGLLLFAIRLLLQYKESKRMSHNALQPASAMWLNLLESTRLKLGISNHISIAFTTRNISPCIIGHAKAIILIPVSISNNLTTEQAEAILLHELAHYKHYDHYINIITQCINCILFFNPFAWLITQQANHYRELACDAAATDNDRNIELAESLAIIARLRISENNLSLSAGKGKLLTRIQSLLKPKQESNTTNRILPIAIVTAVMTVCLLLINNTSIFSTEKNKLRDQLQAISKQMHDEGNFRYVFVDAVLDSLVTLPLKAEVVYLGDQYWSMNVYNGYKPITKAQQQRYKEKLQAFLKETGEDAASSLHFFALSDNTSLTLNDILSPTSSFRTITPSDKYKAGMTHKAWTQIFSSMRTDGLVSHDMDMFAMNYDNNGITVNNIRLTTKMNEQYMKLFKDVLGVDLDKSSVSGDLGLADLNKYLVKDVSSSTYRDYELGKKIYAQIKRIRGEMHKDGLLDTNYKSIIVYRPDFIAVNKYILSPVLVSKYEKMFREKGKLLHSSYGDIEMAGDKMKLDFPDINTLKGRAMLRKADKLQIAIIENMIRDYERSEQEENNKQVVVIKDKNIHAAMHKDGLLDTAYKSMIIYTPNEIWVNEHLLDNIMTQKYTRLFREENKELVGHNNFSVIMTNNEKKVYPSLERLAGKDHLRKPNAEQKKALNNMLASHEKSMRQHEAALVQHEKDLQQHYKELEQHEKDLAQHEKDLQQHYKELEQHEKDLEQHEKDLQQHEKDLKEHYKNTETQKTDDKQYDDMIKSMKNDRLINENSYYLVEYTTKGIYINARKLEGAMAAKYELIFKNNGYKKGQLITERIPDGLAVPDWQVGNATMHLYAHGNNLPAIAEKMFTEGNPNFILAYAIQDKLLKEKERYSFSYNKGTITFQDKPLKEPHASKYSKLMTEFLQAHSKQDNYRMTGDGVTIKMLNTPTSSIRQKRLAYSKNGRDFSYYLTQVVNMMAKDGVIDTTKAHSLKYNYWGIFVNGKKLEDKIAARYEPLLEKGHGDKPRGYLSGDGLNYSSKH